MRIALVVERYPPQLGGQEVRAYQIAIRLARRGHEVHVFTGHRGMRSVIDRLDGVTIHRFPAGKYVTSGGGRSIMGTLQLSVQVARFLNRTEFDIYDFTQFPLLPALLSSVRPLIVSWVEVWSNILRPHGSILLTFSSRLLERLVARKAHFNIAISELTRRGLVSRLGVSESCVVTIPCGVDLKELDSSGILKDLKQICYVGRFAAHKRMDQVLAAWKIISARNSEAHLVLFTVPDDPNFERVLDSSTSLPRVLVARGDREGAIDILKSSAIYVSASQREGFGLAALEAMAAGTVPIVVKSPSSATSEIVKDGQTGFVVEPSCSAIAECTLKLLGNKRLLVRLSENCVAFSSNLSWDNIVPHIEAVYSLARSGLNRRRLERTTPINIT